MIEAMVGADREVAVEQRRRQGAVVREERARFHLSRDRRLLLGSCWLAVMVRRIINEGWCLFIISCYRGTPVLCS